MPLELTAEILSKIESMADATDRQVTVCQWPIIRDLVLEAAAKACDMVANEAMVLSREDGVPADSIRGHSTRGYIHGALFSAEAIRALKG